MDSQQTNPDPDAYYAEDEIDVDQELDLSFLDDADDSSEELDGQNKA